MKEGIYRPGPSSGEQRARSYAVHDTQLLGKVQDDEEVALDCGISGLAN